MKQSNDVTYHLTRQELPFKGHDESDSSLEAGLYTERLQNLNTLWTGDADLRFYITTVQDG